jgi:hypothetical protein
LQRIEEEKMGKATLEVLEPRGEIVLKERTGLSAPRAASLDGKRIAICSEKPDSEMFFNKIAEMIQDAYPTAAIIRFPSSTAPQIPDNTKEVAEACDIWIEGIKTSTSGKSTPDIVLEKLGKPGVSVSLDSLAKQRKAHAETGGMPAVRVVYIPAMDYFKAKSSQALMNEVAAAAYGGIIKALTDPLTEEEQKSGSFDYDYLPKTFSGDTYSDAYEVFLQYCANNFIGDGLPLVPPTREAVDEMLKGTSYPPDKVIGIMEPKSGIATVEKIAISAVMAGAKPEYLPIIITMVETIADENFNQYHIVNEIMPVTLLSGPIIEELGINNDIGYLSAGHRSNSTISRALAMCMINIGWRLMDAYASPGGIGNPASYTFYFIPENQKANPWESFAASNGFGPDENTITICETIVTTRGPSETLSIASFEQDMQQVADIFSLKPDFFGGLSDTRGARFMIAIHPTFASQLADAGYTRESFIQWLHDKNTIDWDKMNEEERAVFKQLASEGKAHGASPEDCKPGLLLEPFTDPKHVSLIVSGNATGGVIVFWTPMGSTSLVDLVKVERPFMHKVMHGATITKSGK